MSSSNLGVCVGPSLIWGSNPSIAEDLRLMPALVDCLITNCEVLMGSHVSHLLGDPRDSGTEESDCKWNFEFDLCFNCTSRIEIQNF